MPLHAIILASSGQLSAVAILGACLGVYLFFHGFGMLRRKRLIMDTPSSKIRSASIGLVEVSGLALGPYLLHAPITALPCYYYRTTAWQYQQRGKDKEWVKVADESLHVLFFLDDNTGRVLVNPQGAEMEIHLDYKEQFGGSLFSGTLELPSNVSTFLSRHGVSLDKQIKIEEHCIKPKNALFVLGTLAENPGIEVSASPVETFSADRTLLKNHMPGLLQPMFQARQGTVTFTTQEVVRLSASQTVASAADMTSQGKIAAAMVRAGISNPAAWAAAGIAFPGANPGAVTPDSAMPAGQFDLQPKTVIMKGTHNPAFFISWRSQRDVLQSLGWQSTMMIWGGPLLALLSVYVLLSQNGLL